MVFLEILKQNLNSSVINFCVVTAIVVFTVQARPTTIFHDVSSGIDLVLWMLMVVSKT